MIYEKTTLEGPHTLPSVIYGRTLMNFSDDFLPSLNCFLSFILRLKFFPVKAKKENSSEIFPFSSCFHQNLSTETLTHSLELLKNFY